MFEHVLHDSVNQQLWVCDHRYTEAWTVSVMCGLCSESSGSPGANQNNDLSNLVKFADNLMNIFVLLVPTGINRIDRIALLIFVLFCLKKSKICACKPCMT